MNSNISHTQKKQNQTRLTRDTSEKIKLHNDPNKNRPKQTAKKNLYTIIGLISWQLSIIFQNLIQLGKNKQINTVWLHT